MIPVYQSTQSIRQPLPKGNAGFTLLETMIGSVILVIVFGSLLITISHGFRVMRASRESLRATQIVLERMEGIRLYNWNQIVYSNMLGNTFTGFFYPPDGGTNGGVVYHGTLTVNNITLNPLPSYAANMRQITVTVLWNSDGIARQRSMSTFVSQNGIQNYVYSH